MMVYSSAFTHRVTTVAEKETVVMYISYICNHKKRMR